VLISSSNAGYTMFRGSVKSTGYPLHSPVSPSLPLLCVTVCNEICPFVFRGNVFKYLTGTLYSELYSLIRGFDWIILVNTGIFLSNMLQLPPTSKFPILRI